MRETESQRRGLPGGIRAILSVPLAAKLAGANAIIVVVASAIAFVPPSPVAGELRSTWILVGTLVATFVVNVVLVTLALRPLRQLESTVERVWKGDLSARVPESLLADRNMDRIGRMLNLLLEDLASDQERIRKLARRVIAASDSEKANVARVLHDSAAQSLAALALQASAAAKHGSDGALSERLSNIREIATAILDEVRVLGQSLHPSVLDDLGLAQALRKLARETAERSPGVNIGVSVNEDSSSSPIPPDVATTLYQVAREGMQNAIVHAAAREISLEMNIAGNAASLVVSDDGRGFDVQAAEKAAGGAGLFGMRERLAMIQGQLKIMSDIGKGTRLFVTVPLQTGKVR